MSLLPDYKEIITNGQFYYPASKHYARPCDVVCDRCQRHNLKACIGYGSMDLCLACANDIANFPFDQSPPPCLFPVRDEHVTNMEQGQFLTFMLQDQFRDESSGPSGPLTRMLQWQYEK